MTTSHQTNHPVDIVVATGNPGKLTELRALLGPAFRVMSAAECEAEMPEETEQTFEGNAVLKAVAVARQTGKVAIADDSGLEVDALGGAPGVYSARYSGPGATDASNRDKLLKALNGVPTHKRSARFVSVIAIAFTPEDVVTAEGSVGGTITTEERGSGGFGYDSLFQLTSGKTLAEVPAEEKNRISHRGRAMVLARQILEDRFNVEAIPEGDA